METPSFPTRTALLCLSLAAALSGVARAEKTPEKGTIAEKAAYVRSLDDAIGTQDGIDRMMDGLERRPKLEPVLPVVVERGESSPRRSARQLAPSRYRFHSSRRGVPAVNLSLKEHRREERRLPFGVSGGVAAMTILGLGLLAAGLTLASSSGGMPPPPAAKGPVSIPNSPPFRRSPLVFRPPPLPVEQPAGLPRPEPRAAPLPRSPRAISWAEELVIDAWTASPERAAGLASLEEWLDLKGCDYPEVDVDRLKAKIIREV